MSKGNMLQGQARGKVGDLVFYVRQGVQQTRVRNRKPENPRTISQMYQRVKLAAVVGFYKRQASFFRFALKKSQTESYYNAFVRYNINLSPYLTKEQATSNYAIPAPYVIADGDMPRVRIISAEATELTTLELTTSLSASWSTWGDMRRGMGLILGDMMSLVVFNAPDDATEPVKRIVCQHKFDAESENMPIGYDMVGTEWVTSGNYQVVNVNSTYFGLNEFFATGSAIVISRNNGEVECSYAKLFLDPTAAFNYQEYRTEAQREIAAASYGKESDAILDPKQFEGNYVDLATLYQDAELQTPITAVNVDIDEEGYVYFDKVKWPSIHSLTYQLVSGAVNVDQMGTDGSGKVTFHTSEAEKETGTYKINFVNIEGFTVAAAYLTINIIQ